MRIVNTGMYVPERVVPNSEITASVKWVEENLGIKQRRAITLGQTTSSIAFASSYQIGTDIDLLIVATATPNFTAPSTACRVAQRLELTCPAFDVNAVCSGFLYALSIAEQYLSIYKRILVIGVDTFSTITDWKDRNCVFFGDGAGAVVVERGTNLKAIYIGADYSEQGFTCETGEKFKMDTKLVYEAALRLVPEAIQKALDEAKLKIEDITWMVPHQPSKRILNDIADKIGLPREKVLMNMERYANTSAATIPILLHESWDKFKKGDLLLMASIGSGWTIGAAIYEI